MICATKDTRLRLQQYSGEMRWVYLTKLPTNGDDRDVGIGINSPMPFDSCLHWSCARILASNRVFASSSQILLLDP